MEAQLQSKAMTFTLLDRIEIFDGSVTRKIALYEGDLAAIPREHYSDILVVSAFPDDYLPTRTSLIGALHRAGISVAHLAADKAHDLRASSAFWISKPLDRAGIAANIGRVACFEPMVRGSPPDVVGDLFRGLFPFLDDRINQTVAMSLPAAGDQGWSPDQMLRSLLHAASHWLARGLAVSELKIVVRDSTLAGTIADFKSKLVKSQLKPSNSNTYDVFLSFSSVDGAAADRVRSELKKREDTKTIFDFRLHIDRGASWQEHLDRAISSSRKIVAILSPEYFASTECREELMQARLRNKRSDRAVLVPIYWRDWGKELDLWLQIVNYVDCREGNYGALTHTMCGLDLS